MLNKNQTLIILDWDDTLFPTSWTIKNNIDLTSQSTHHKYFHLYNKLDKILYNVIHKFQQYGQIVIVTNALTSWIHDSSSVLPRTKKLLKNINIVSARELYQTKYDTMTEWKKYTFRDEVKKQIQAAQPGLYTTDHINIISVGDADYEYKALIDLYNFTFLPRKHKKILKSIKLLRSPTHGSLLDQLIVLHHAIPDICTHTSHLDWQFKKL